MVLYLSALSKLISKQNFKGTTDKSALQGVCARTHFPHSKFEPNTWTQPSTSLIQLPTLYVNDNPTLPHRLEVVFLIKNCLYMDIFLKKEFCWFLSIRSIWKLNCHVNDFLEGSGLAKPYP